MLTTAVSGLNANAERVGVAATNIANVSTKGYQPREVATQSLERGGVQVVSRPLNAPNVNPEAFSGTDIGQEFATLIQAESAYSANLKIIEAAENMARSLVNETV